MSKQIKAFTLVELIVVITILAILGTIAFISFQGYSRDSRDSVRISDMNNIEKAMELMLLKGSPLPKPEESVNILASGSIIGYQGISGEYTLSKIGLNNGGKDPLDDRYYTYVSTDKLNKYQILGYLEQDTTSNNLNILENTYAKDYSSRFPVVKGNNLGVILNTGSLEPVTTDVDIVLTNDEYSIVLDDNEYFTGTGTELSLFENVYKYGIGGSCNDILQKNKNSLNNDGVYITIPNGKENVKVYCDMTTDGGGWTIVYNQFWSDNEKIVGNIDSTIGTPGKDSEYRINPYLFYSNKKLDLLLVQDSNWLKLGDTTISTFDDIFNEIGNHPDDIKITGSSSGIGITYMDQDNHYVSSGVYQWNNILESLVNRANCFEYSKNGSDNNHEWIVYPNCDGNYSLANGIGYPRKAMVGLR